MMKETLNCADKSPGSVTAGHGPVQSRSVNQGSAAHLERRRRERHVRRGEDEGAARAVTARREVEQAVGRRAEPLALRGVTDSNR